MHARGMVGSARPSIAGRVRRRTIEIDGWNSSRRTSRPDPSAPWPLAETPPGSASGRGFEHGLGHADERELAPTLTPALQSVREPAAAPGRAWTRTLAASLLATFAPALAAQCELQRLHAPVPAPVELFGGAVALDSGRALIGARLQDPASPGELGCNSGAAHVYAESSGGFQFEATLVPSDAACGAYFGDSLDLHGPRAVVGAPAAPGFDGSPVGRAYVFEASASTWSEAAVLRAPDAAAGDGFGSSVAVAGDWVAIGAPGRAHFGIQFVGAVYLFRRAAHGWVYHQRLVDPFPEELAGFGGAVALDGARLLIGVPGERENGAWAGAAYVYGHPGAGAWTYETKLVPSDGGWGQRFGSAVALDGDRAAVGALNGTDGQPDVSRVRLFERSGSGGWSEIASLAAPDRPLGARFGGSVALNGEHLLVGAAFDDGLSGSAYLFRREAGGEWRPRAKLRPRAQRPVDFVGVDVALDGARGLALVGASAVDDFGLESGAADLFASTAFAAPFCACEPISPCGNFDALDGCRNSTGGGARLAACGSPSVAADDLTLRGDGLPANVGCLLACGLVGTPHTFGDGLACLATPIARFAATSSTPEGTSDHGPGLGGFAAANFPLQLHFLPGRTLAFQLWHRDGHGPCGRGSNWSSALAVTLEP